MLIRCIFVMDLSRARHSNAHHYRFAIDNETMKDAIRRPIREKMPCGRASNDNTEKVPPEREENKKNFPVESPREDSRTPKPFQNIDWAKAHHFPSPLALRSVVFRLDQNWRKKSLAGKEGRPRSF